MHLRQSWIHGTAGFVDWHLLAMWAHVYCQPRRVNCGAKRILSGAGESIAIVPFRVSAVEPFEQLHAKGSGCGTI